MRKPARFTSERFLFHIDRMLEADEVFRRCDIYYKLMQGQDTKMSLKKVLRSVGDAFAETLWPTRCAICDLPGFLLCESCAAKLKFVDATLACDKCGAPYGIIQCSECMPDSECDDPSGSSHQYDFPFDAMASALIADNAAKRIVTTYKDRNEQRLSELIAQFMSRYIDPDWTRNAIHISFIPSTKVAYRKRGFDHIELIAHSLGNLTGITVIPLFKRPESIDQRKLGRHARRSNMENRFEILNTRLPQRVLLIDDISTTGATMRSAASTLRKAGVDKIYGLTFGKVLD